MKMDTDLIHAPAVGLTEEEEADMNDWKLPLAFMKKRHLEKIEGSKALAQSWRMKDRVNIWLVRQLLCLSFCAFFLQRIHLLFVLSNLHRSSNVSGGSGTKLELSQSDTGVGRFMIADADL